MFRQDDFNSNAVARFPTNHISSFAEINLGDGGVPKLIFTASPYSPGSSIEEVVFYNLSSSTKTVQLRLGTVDSLPFVELNLAVGQNTFSKLLKLEPDAELFCNSVETLLVDERIGITLFGVNY